MFQNWNKTSGIETYHDSYLLDLTCYNGGSCMSDGHCACLNGYTGALCEHGKSHSEYLIICKIPL